MSYLSFSLNGSWEMGYAPEAYADAQMPEFSGISVENAVPGYWEDMTDSFLSAPFFRHLKINPEYGIQRYPMAGWAPDMALPNIMGNFFYRRSFQYEGAYRPCAFHFEGVQNTLRLWLNGHYLGCHAGYSTPFEIYVPENTLHNGENTIVLSISNTELPGYDGFPVTGLTNRAACQYTGGITGDVSFRIYQSSLRDAAVLISDDCTEAAVDITCDGPAVFTWAVMDDSKCIFSGSADGSFSFSTAGLTRWTPETPKLYTLELNCGEAKLTRSFGVRRLTTKGSQILLNGIPCYLRGICEHCYYPETIHPNHDISFYRNVIRKLKSLGFNFIRFHTHIPTEEYLQAADELGILMEVESPNYASFEEWKQIVAFCRHHTSVVMYCCGNELLMDDPFIEHQRQCAQVVHEKTDSLFSPMSAMRGLEYSWIEEDQKPNLIHTPFTHHPRRFKTVSEFCDVYNSFTLSMTSYDSLNADPKQIDSWNLVYQKPRLSHEICIQGTYTDLSLESRYAGTHVGRTDMFSSLRKHLDSKGLLHKAPLFFQNSSEWQRRLRKHCFEATRMCQHLAGFDFLGPIDTHWHTFGYDVGMMNEFYELKPGETERNVRMYNSPTVLLTDLGTDFVFTAGQEIAFGIFTSHYGPEALTDARLNIRLTADGKLLASHLILLDMVKNGEVTKLHDFRTVLPQVSEPAALKLYATLESGDTYSENEWELYLFPDIVADSGDLVVMEEPSEGVLRESLCAGKNVLLLGNTPFTSLPTYFQIGQAGRTVGNLATVIADHPVLNKFPHDGFCGWQFRRLLEGGNAVCFDNPSVPFDPIIEVASSHKFAIPQSILFEFQALGGRLLVCGFHFSDSDPAAKWLKAQLIRYAQSDAFDPVHTLHEAQLNALISGKVVKAAEITNIALNPNDKASNRNKRK